MPTVHGASKLLLCCAPGAEASRVAKLLDGEAYRRIEVVTEQGKVMPLLDGGSFDLLLLDLEMPGGDAILLTGEIRRRFSEAELPILAITESVGGDSRNQALAAGASDYLRKPVDRVALALRISSLLALRDVRKAHLAIENHLGIEVAAWTTKLDMLIENGLMLSMERDRSKLLQHILVEGQALLNCDGATLYLVTEKKTLRFAIRTKDDDLPAFEIPLHDPETGLPNEKFVATFVALHNRPVLIDDVYQESRFDLSGTRSFDQDSGYRTVSMLTVPMAPRGGEVIGVLQFMNALDPGTGSIIPFSQDLLALVEALAAQAAVALDNLQLVEAQKALVENMIRVIATAIDAKSPYTGRHCNRVPELALMLAEAASAAESGAMAGFRFDTPEQWREFRIGTWLHDCGKVTTPEYVIDKATKLETIYNRIHEIRMRFEVLLRDAEIERLRALQDGADPDQCGRRYEERKARLQDDFAFIAECNIGGETMAAEHFARLKSIAETEWLRNFDDRLGISYAEAVLRRSETVSGLPAVERLLADKARDLVPREPSDIPDPSFKFKMQVPEYLYNRGELYNLGIRRGTLTEEERYKINEHMVHTIVMLERMNLPESLRRVPEYAGTHHEKLDGGGYPRRLGAAELSVPARIVAVADIFEALTAPDRPYKKPNKVSEAIRILYQLKRIGHIDPDVFDLFLSSGVYRKYTERFLTDDQNDEVDISLFLGPVAGEGRIPPVPQQAGDGSSPLRGSVPHAALTLGRLGGEG